MDGGGGECITHTPAYFLYLVLLKCSLLNADANTVGAEGA